MCWLANDFSIYRQEVLEAQVTRNQRSHVMVLKLDFEASLKYIVPMHSTKVHRVVDKLVDGCFFL